MRKYFSTEAEAKEFNKKVNGSLNVLECLEEPYIVVYDDGKFDLRPFIRHCLTDKEFWESGGIPTKEKYYIDKLNMTEEQVHVFYDAMCSLQHLSKEIARQ